MQVLCIIISYVSLSDTFWVTSTYRQQYYLFLAWTCNYPLLRQSANHSFIYIGRSIQFSYFWDQGMASGLQELQEQGTAQDLLLDSDSD
jgi:hypothetical protein